MVVGGGVGGLKAAVGRGRARPPGHALRGEPPPRRPGAARRAAAGARGVRRRGHQPAEARSSRYGVKVVTGSASTLPSCADSRPDAVVVATGATPRDPPSSCIDDPVVLDAWEVIKGADVPSGRVVVADWRCDWIGLGVAELLARAGAQGHARRRRLHGRAAHPAVRARRDDQGRRCSPASRSCRWCGCSVPTPTRVYLQHVLTDEPVIVDDVAALVLSQGHDSVDRPGRRAGPSTPERCTPSATAWRRAPSRRPSSRACRWRPPSEGGWTRRTHACPVVRYTQFSAPPEPQNAWSAPLAPSADPR